MPNEAVEHLLASQMGDGGWGAYVGSPSRTESTALAVLSLTLEPEVDVDRARVAARNGERWLLDRQLVSGAWPLGDDVPIPNWSTALASLALSHIPERRPAASAGGDWLLGQRPRGAPWWLGVMNLFRRRSQVVELDPDLIGWPWVGDTFSWVEPTCYGLLALKRLGLSLPASETAPRIEQAERMLLDRQCPDGGWNYGNSLVFGDTLWSYPDTTALVLLALGDREGDPALAKALDALPRLVEVNESPLALGLSAAALATHGRDAGPLRARLRRKLDAWAGGEIRGLAWAALGLVAGSDPLGVRSA